MPFTFSFLACLCSPLSPAPLTVSAATTARFHSAVVTALSGFFHSSTLRHLPLDEVPILLATLHLTRISCLVIASTAAERMTDEDAAPLVP